MSHALLNPLPLLTLATCLAYGSLANANANASESESAAPGAHASELHYGYLEAGAVRVKHDHDEARNGFSLRGSAALADHWHLFAGYRGYAVGPFDVVGTRVGIGFNTPLSEKVDFVARAGYEKLDVSGHADSTYHGYHPHEADGASLELGVRAALSDRFEGQLGVRQVFFDESETLLLIGGEYHFNSSWALSADLDLAEGGNELFVGLRWYF